MMKTKSCKGRVKDTFNRRKHHIYNIFQICSDFILVYHVINKFSKSVYTEEERGSKV